MISPLIALMQDQSQQLPCLLPSLVLSGTIQPSELLHCIDLIRSGIIKILFLSPERLFSSFFQRLLKETDLVHQIKIVVVDEAHCISSWSFNFRADYLRLYRVIETIRTNKEEKKDCSILCLTATGGKLVKEDICKQLHIEEVNCIDEGWYRQEIQLASVTCSQPTGCHQYSFQFLLITRILLQFLQSSYFSQSTKKQTVLIFVPFRKDTTVVYDFLESYHFNVFSFSFILYCSVLIIMVV